MRKTDLVRKGEGDIKTNARLSALAKDRGLVVLVDKTTKSAAEMLAGALRDNQRARLIGARTFGKGVVQRVWEFENGTSVKVTSAKFFLPGGGSINGVGVKPDFAVKSTAHGDRQLAAAQLWLHSQHQPQQAKTEHSDLSTQVAKDGDS